MVLTKLSVRASPNHLSRRGVDLHFKHLRVSAVNRIATRTFREKQQQQQLQQRRFFLSTLF